MRDMMFTVDLSGHDDDGNAEIMRFGGLFLSVDQAQAHARDMATRGRLAFRPKTIWVRDQEGQLAIEPQSVTDG